MAVDTARKRASALNMLGGYLLPIPDGSVNVGDRAMMVDQYTGLVDAEVGGGGGGSLYWWYYGEE